MPLIVDDERRLPTSGDSVIKILHGATPCRRRRAEHVRHDLWLVGVCDSSSLVELLDIREIQSALRAGPLWVATHVEVHFPKDPKLRRDDGVCLENPAATEVRPQALKDDDVRRDDEEGLG